MRWKRKAWISVFLGVVLSAGCVFSGSLETEAKKKTPKKAYGVFTGLERKDRKRLKNYKTVVIDAEYFEEKDIRSMHKSGQKVYSYLNIGSIETYRSYYKKFKSIIIKPYENWEDEYWIDVSKSSWQKFVVNTLAKNLSGKNVDGFFLDNVDVYYICRKEKIYKGLMKIIKDLNKKYKKKIIINGGDTFVRRALKKHLNKKDIQGVNQECVLTSIDFKTKTFGRQSKDNRKYYETYLKKCKKKGLQIYLTEYAKKGSRMEKEVKKYCKKRKYQYYTAHNIELDGR